MTKMDITTIASIFAPLILGSDSSVEPSLANKERQFLLNLITQLPEEVPKEIPNKIVEIKTDESEPELPVIDIRSTTFVSNTNIEEGNKKIIALLNFSKNFPTFYNTI